MKCLFRMSFRIVSNYLTCFFLKNLELEFFSVASPNLSTSLWRFSYTSHSTSRVLGKNILSCMVSSNQGVSLNRVLFNVRNYICNDNFQPLRRCTIYLFGLGVMYCNGVETSENLLNVQGASLMNLNMNNANSEFPEKRLVTEFSLLANDYE